MEKLTDSPSFAGDPHAELEGKLMDHPDVNDVAVIGIMLEEQHTEVPRAYVVPGPGSTRDEAAQKEIVEWLSGRVANHKRLRGGVRFVDGEWGFVLLCCAFAVLLLCCVLLHDYYS